MCGCGGTLPAVPGRPALAAPPAGVKYVVKYPNDAEQPFDHEWAAAGAVAMSGGLMWTQYPDGRKQHTDGRIEHPDGRVRHPDGRIEHPDGRIEEPATPPGEPGSGG